MEIRKLNTNDIITFKDSIYELLTICLQSTYQGEMVESLIDDKYTGLIEYVNEGQAHTFGAIKDASLIGFLWGYPVETPLEKVFHIAYISVLNNGRRMGIGEKLIAEAEKECKRIGLQHVELIVGAENKSAMCFYDYCGYKQDRYYLRKEVR